MPAPHGDPLLQAAQAEPGHQAIGVGELLPVRGMPSKQGEWVKNRGMLVLSGKTCCATSAKRQRQMHSVPMLAFQNMGTMDAARDTVVFAVICSRHSLMTQQMTLCHVALQRTQ